MRSNKKLKLEKSLNKILLFLFIVIFIILPLSTILSAQEEENYLIVISENNVVDAKEIFSVVVKDKDEDPVEDATVYIQSVYSSSDTTNKDGRVWLDAPGDRTEITIIAQKKGYEDGSTTIKVNIPLSLLELILNPDALIVIAVILLISAIIFVNLRRRKSINVRAKEISNDQNLIRHGVHGTILSDSSFEETKHKSEIGENMYIEGKRGPKVEEIRISRPRKDKDVVSVEAEEEENKNVVDRKIRKRYNYDWFEGTDNIRYEIDKITGEIDEEGKDKWFEGIDDIRAKIDEKLKKKDKKADK